ncbi:MAG: chorismate synthase [Eubacteriaceae bacterium]|nr:chorismate synthase [Eubacteriaceae bacterium]
MRKYEFGKRLRLGLFGTSHGPFVGASVSGLPAGASVDIGSIKAFMARRSPGGAYSSSRKEDDEFIIHSGLDGDTVSGEELLVTFPNKNVKREDYDALKHIPRPSHADLGAYLKYGIDYDMSGGGPFSARLTAGLCFAGAVAMQLLKKEGCSVAAHIYSIGEISDRPFDRLAPQIDAIDPVFPVVDVKRGEDMKKAISEASEAGDSLGCVIECAVTGFPAGVGGALFEGIESRLSEMLFAIPAVKGVDFGGGFELSGRKGSDSNDEMYYENGRICLYSNNSGGISGGISTCAPIIMRVFFKPVSSIACEQRSIDMAEGKNVKIKISGRHDPCVGARAVPIVEAAAAFALYDMLLDSRRNIYLIGMPGSGKTTVGKTLAGRMGRAFFDSDEIIVEENGMSIERIFSEKGEEAFRDMEEKVITGLSAMENAVIATGGGSILRERNRRKMKETGVCIWLQRDLGELSTEGRPLSKSLDELKAMYRTRMHVYELMADLAEENTDTPEKCADRIIGDLL